MIELHRHGAPVELIIQHVKPQNPFPMEMTRELAEVCRELERDDEVASFPALSYRLTKQLQNGRMIQALDGVADEAARIHARCILEGDAQQHFSRLLGSKL